MGQAADVPCRYEALCAALLVDGMRRPLAYLRLAVGGSRTAGAPL